MLRLQSLHWEIDISNNLPFDALRRSSPSFCRRPPYSQVPNGLSRRLAHEFHLVDVATRMQLIPMDKAAHCVPFSSRTGIKMTLYKGPDALAARRAVAKALTPSLITALQRPRRADDKTIE